MTGKLRLDGGSKALALKDGIDVETAKLPARGVFAGPLLAANAGIIRRERRIRGLPCVAGQLIRGLNHQTPPADRNASVTPQPIERGGRGLSGSAHKTSNVPLRKMELHPAERAGRMGFAPTQQQASDSLLDFQEGDPLHLLFEIPYAAAKLLRIRLPEFRVRLGIRASRFAWNHAHRGFLNHLGRRFSPATAE